MSLTLQQARAAYEFADEAHDALIDRNRKAELDAWNANVLPHLAALLDLDSSALNEHPENAVQCLAPWKRET